MRISVTFDAKTRENLKIGAIKFIRQISGLSLCESKKLFEANIACEIENAKDLSLDEIKRKAKEQKLGVEIKKLTDNAHNVTGSFAISSHGVSSLTIKRGGSVVNVAGPLNKFAEIIEQVSVFFDDTGAI